MFVIKPISYLVLIFPVVIFFLLCNRPHTGGEYRLGEIHFDINSSSEAKEHFRTGMLLLHSFEYKDAAAEFTLARQADPDLILAYWGEAMTHHHTLWNAQYTEEAMKILEKLGATPEERVARAETALEKDLVRGANILFGKGDKFERDKAYAQHMEMMYKRYPHNEEVSAFYALSLLGAGGEKRDSAYYGKAARIAKGIIQENPDHPGALHYMIHACDDPAHAIQAIEAAHRYAEVAPDASHALHMPSHIFVAMGMWDEVVKSNVASFKASVSRMEEKGLDGDARSYHALHWLQYGFLQQGESAKARDLLKDMISYANELPSPSARAHLTMMRGTFVIDAFACEDSLAWITIDDVDLNESLQAINNYVKGYCAWQRRNAVLLDSAIGQLQEIRKHAELEVYQRGATMCSGISWATQLPSELDIGKIKVMELQLNALAAVFRNEISTTESMMRSAAQLESSLSYSYGPPQIVKPSYELLGDWLMAYGRNEEAMHAYEMALDRAPKRRRSTLLQEM